MSKRRLAVRIEQSADELERLKADLDRWLSAWRAKDSRKQYATQLNTLDKVLNVAIDGLGDKLGSLSGETDIEIVYEKCRILDRQRIWLNRVWDYYRSKFDQRNDERHQKALKAADEVVWSCYALVFEKAKGVDRGTAPLPYIDQMFSPQAIPREDPSDLRSQNRQVSDFMAEYLRELPIPVVTLPPDCLESPWWLIYLGHEVGHHIQHDLKPDWELVNHFGDWLESKATKAGGDDATNLAKSWKAWGQEIYADSFSLYMMGASALWTMTELEIGSERSMLVEKQNSRARYPSPVVRLALMDKLATDLGLDGTWGLQSVKPQEYSTGEPIMHGPKDLRILAARHLALVPTLAPAIQDYDMSGLGKFQGLCDFRAGDYKSNGAVARWTKMLRGEIKEEEHPSLDAPRQIASGGIQAWAQIRDLPADEREDEISRLRELLPGIIEKNREEGTRSSKKPPPPKDLTGYGEQLFDRLMSADAQELGL